MCLAKLEDNNVSMISVDKLRIHPVNRQIYVSDKERRMELLESIREHGILEPLVVMPDMADHLILSGARRFECAKELGYSELPCVVTIVKDQTLAIIEHNKYRQKTPIEIYNEAHELRSILEPKARRRQGWRGDLSSNLMEGRETVDVQKKVADSLNVSVGYLSMLEQVIENRQEIPEVVKRLEGGRETVYSAYKLLKGKQTSETEIPRIFIGHYFAGKQRLVKDIIARMPTHNCYVEVFGGFCSVLLNKPPSEVEVYARAMPKLESLLSSFPLGERSLTSGYK